ncbi:Bestrophin, RFP-TM, chloride channel-domain-containing protein [Infundibulicybe gibba]|nr:Bestrophin, RFP-TM, chloride channel-domain-containing protein [Infundibulicybe gibba]
MTSTSELEKPPAKVALLPASRAGSKHRPALHLPNYSLISWTFGRGSVIRRIWPAVLLNTFFSAVVVTLDMEGIASLQIPSIMLTVLGVVIGFVISYRASSGYDRYWMGRTCWSDVIRNARTTARLIWFHKAAQQTSQQEWEEAEEVMEKLAALDLVEAFAVSLKHHIRGELGIHYEDLYPLVAPLHSDSSRVWRGPTVMGTPTADGDHLPLAILHRISAWCGILEERGPSPGRSSAVSQPLERILTTPLPFVYAVHIRHTVWLYLILMPFQLVRQFGYATIPGVALAAFTYLGFLAAGEEIEQPFGYDENDLDLDMFCRDIRADIAQLRRAPGRNAPIDALFEEEAAKREGVDAPLVDA